MDSDNVKKYTLFVFVVAAAVAVGFLMGWWWTKRTFPLAPSAGSGTRVMSPQEVQDALQTLGEPAPRVNKSLTPQEVQQALKSLGAPGK